MPVDQEVRRLTFQRLGRMLSKLAAKPEPASVHRFRTNSRRLEALLEELSETLTRNDKKLLKSLARLRKKAGHVRDLDVQIGALENLKIPQEPARKSQLMRMLAEERTKREKKLAKALDPETLRELRRRLRRSEAESHIPENTDPAMIATRLFTGSVPAGVPLSENTLHQYRMSGKRARYVAEMAGDNPAAQAIVAQLKHLQDAVGEWHDWLQLSQRAEKLFAEVPNSALVAALRNVRRAKFRIAVDILSQTRTAFAAKTSLHRLANAGPARKQPPQSSGNASAVA